MRRLLILPALLASQFVAEAAAGALAAPPLPVAAPVRVARHYARSSGTAAKRAWKRRVRGGHARNRPRSR